MTDNQKRKARAIKIVESSTGILFFATLVVVIWFFPDFPFHAKGFMRWVKAFCVFIPLALLWAGVYAFLDYLVNRHFDKKDK